MRTTPVIFTLLSALTLCAQDRISISVCNFAHLSSAGLTKAESEVALVFRSADIDIRWDKCGAKIDRAAGSERHFIIRVRGDGQSVNRGRARPPMGRAFDTPGFQYLYADVYYDVARQFATLYAVADSYEILGYAIAHELGHLILGPKHAPEGLMVPRWRRQELEAMCHQALRFTKSERAAIRNQLHKHREHILLYGASQSSA
jgi:hypothetical protein